MFHMTACKERMLSTVYDINKLELFLPVYIHHNHLSLDTKQSVHLILPAKHYHLKQQIENQKFFLSLCQQLLQYILRKQKASKWFFLTKSLLSSVAQNSSKCMKSPFPLFFLLWSYGMVCLVIFFKWVFPALYLFNK